ncbi:MAG: zinc ribbon domain-containing protein [Fibrobacterota bacterium]
MFCPQCGASNLNDARFCGTCGAAVTAGPITRETEVFTNTSGRPCSDAELPAEAKKLSWGAFWFGWIWGLFNGTYIALLTLLLPFIFNVILLIKGRQWAWENKKWDSAADFERVQRLWGIWGWILTLAAIVFCVIGVIFIMGLAAFSGALS